MRMWIWGSGCVGSQGRAVGRAVDSRIIVISFSTLSITVDSEWVKTLFHRHTWRGEYEDGRCWGLITYGGGWRREHRDGWNGVGEEGQRKRVWWRVK